VNTATFEAINAFNISGPDPWMGITLPRTDWVYLFYGLLRNLVVSRLAHVACALATIAYLFRAGLRLKPPLDNRTRALFCAALVCLGLLCVYHHQYDACPFFAPLLLAFFGAPELKETRAAWLSLPFLLMIFVLPFGQTQRVITAIFVGEWVALLKMSFPLVISLSLVGTLIELGRKSVHVGLARSS
jgi:hypothetical protein